MRYRKNPATERKGGSPSWRLKPGMRVQLRFNNGPWGHARPVSEVLVRKVSDKGIPFAQIRVADTEGANAYRTPQGHFVPPEQGGKVWGWTTFIVSDSDYGTRWRVKGHYPLKRLALVGGTGQRHNPQYFAVSFPAPEKGRIKLAKWISQNTTNHVRGQGWYSPKDQELVFFYKSPSSRMDAILAVADAYKIQGRVRSDLVPMERVRAQAPSVTPRQAQDAAEKLGYHRTSEIVGPGGLSGASMAALVRLVREASRLQNPARKRRRNPHPLPEWAKKLTDPSSYAVQHSHGGAWIQGPQGDLRKSFPSEAAARAYLDSSAHRDYAAKLQNYYAMDPMKGDVARVKLLSGETVEIALKTPSDVHTASELARESGYYIATTPFYDKWARKKAGLSPLTKGQYAALMGGGR